MNISHVLVGIVLVIILIVSLGFVVDTVTGSAGDNISAESEETGKGLDCIFSNPDKAHKKCLQFTTAGPQPVRTYAG